MLGSGVRHHTVDREAEGAPEGSGTIRQTARQKVHQWGQAPYGRQRRRGV